MGQGYFTGLGVRSAADEGRQRTALVDAAERPLLYKLFGVLEQARGRIDLHDAQHFFVTQRRQDALQCPGQ